MINRKYKDSLFRMLFGENRENALSLYNAVNGSSYGNAEELKYTTLGDVVYIGMKNDVSFLFDHTMSLYEHQSSVNPNMPLRGFLYFADLYRKEIVSGEVLYGRKLVPVPTPRYIVFYNGVDKQPEMKKLRLSDAFEIPDSSGDFEWTATVININGGENELLKEKCRALADYTFFVEYVRMYNKSESVETAIDMAVDACIEKGILAEFLSRNRKEVCNMTLTEFNEDKFRKILREEGYEDGREEGYKKGLEDGRKMAEIENCLENGLDKNVILSRLQTKFNISAEEAEELYNTCAAAAV